MPQVPYNPIPSVSPENIATPGPRLDTPIGAFGGDVAAATSKLGGALERAGDEIFARAYAMQQLNNEAEARQADTDYMIEAGKLHAEFNTLQGQDAVKAFPKYAQDLKDARERIRGTLKNPASRRFFDQQSMGTMGRSIFNGAGVAASAGKRYYQDTLVGQSNVDAKTVEDAPNDEALFQEKLRRTEENQIALAGSTGFEATNPHTVDMVAKAKSQLALQRITGMARNQPFQASKLFDEYKAKGLLYGNDVNIAEQRVQSFAQTTGVTTIADKVLQKYQQPDGTYAKSFQDMQNEARKQASDAWPNDPKIETAAAAAFDRNYNQVKWAKAQDNAEVKKQVSEYILKGVHDPNLLPPDLLARMTPDQVKQYPADANRYRASLDKQTNQAEYDRLLGLYNNNNAEFMDTNVFRVPGLSKSNINFFLGLQRKAEASGDPRVSRAMNWIKGANPAALDALSVTGPRMDRDTHNQFVGALHSAIQGWQEEYGQPPKEKEIVETIFPSLLRKITEPGYYFGWLGSTSQVETFKSKLPQPVIDEATKALGHEPTEVELSQIRGEYLRAQFEQFYKTTRGKFGDRFPAGAK